MKLKVTEPSKYLDVTEPEPGCLEVRCSISNMPINRTNEYGMFCGAKPCACEAESIQTHAALIALITFNFTH